MKYIFNKDKEGVMDTNRRRTFNRTTLYDIFFSKKLTKTKLANCNYFVPVFRGKCQQIVHVFIWITTFLKFRTPSGMAAHGRI